MIYNRIFTKKQIHVLARHGFVCKYTPFIYYEDFLDTKSDAF